MPTFSLNSTSAFKTGQYKRTLPYFTSRAPGSDPDQYIAPSTGAGITTGSVDAMVLGTGSGYVESITPGDYVSDNTRSGITFLVFNRVANIQGVDLNVGGENGSGNTQDFGDSIYIETGDHSTNSTTKPVNFIDSSIVTGTANSPANDNDLVVFGSDQSKDGQTYVIAARNTANNANLVAATISGLLAPGSVQAPLTLQKSSVSTGNGNDTLIFANTVADTKIGGTVSDGNLFDLGAGNDLVYFAAPSTIYAGNTVNLGAGSDTLVFNFRQSGASAGAGFTNLTSAAPLTIQGLGDSGDRLYYNGVLYDTSTLAGRNSALSATGNKIQFS